MRRVPRRAPAPPRWVLGERSAAEEISAEKAANQFAVRPGSLAKSIAGLSTPTHGLKDAPGSVNTAIRDPGRPLDSSTRAGLEHHYGHDLKDVRIHDGAAAQHSARDVDSLAYSVGNHIVLGSGQPAAHTVGGRHLLAHEVAHVVQGGPPDVVRRYRPSSAMAFGELDTATFKEQSFNPKTDKETKPWIDLVTVQFTKTDTDSDGNVFWTGTATAEYYPNLAMLSRVTFTVSGGSSTLGRSDAGNFTVHRIEGYGYNSGSGSGIPGVDFKWSDREKANRRYTKKDSAGDRAANMSLAVFYNRGEALHVGPLDFSSHGCLHVDWAAMLQVNYHSVIGLTKVTVSYPSKP